jgi:uncharacterized protein
MPVVAASLGRAAAASLGNAAAAAGAATVWGIGIERYLYTVRYHALRVLPGGADALKVLHISDLHMAPWQRRKQDWIASLAGLAPDLIVNTGDNLGHRDGLQGLRNALAPFEGVPGVFVHGSNDVQGPSFRNPLRYFSGPSAHHVEIEHLDTDAMDAFFAELGWTDLNDTATGLQARGVRINAFGVDDPHRRWDDLEKAQDAASALSPGDVTLGVAHAPYRRILDAFTDLGADLLLAGHTHGGQVRVPLSRKALVANCDIPLDQARGLSEWSHAGRTIPLNVSAGVGHSIYAPVRFACRPEVTLLTLLPR